MRVKKRVGYAAGLLAVIFIEALIGKYVRDGFIRPYMGDVLAVVALYLLARVILPEGRPWLPLAVFLTAAAVECMQGLGWGNLPVVRDSRVLRIALGSTFDLADIACYAAGCGLVWLIGRMRRK